MTSSNIPTGVKNKLAISFFSSGDEKLILSIKEALFNEIFYFS
jgi:hypothetical protein